MGSIPAGSCRRGGSRRPRLRRRLDSVHRHLTCLTVRRPRQTTRPWRCAADADRRLGCGTCCSNRQTLIEAGGSPEFTWASTMIPRIPWLKHDDPARVKAPPAQPCRGVCRLWSNPRRKHPPPILEIGCPRRDTPNVVAMPHRSGGAQQTRQRMWEMTRENLPRVVDGAALLTVCDTVALTCDRAYAG